jgi:hypothetical protein
LAHGTAEVHEPLRLFEDGPEEAEALAKAEATAPSRPETSLQVVLQAARLVTEAQARFTAAVSNARAAGLSWRRIGTVTGVPYQSLHRRFSEQTSSEVLTRKRSAARNKDRSV